MEETLALSDGRELAEAAPAELFEDIYVRHRTAVFRYLRARTASDEDAADLAALTFERALTAFPRYRPSGGGVLAWLFRIARNAAIDEARHRRIAAERDPLANDPAAEADPGDALARSETADEVRALLTHLPEVAREAVLLRYGAGLTAREIGLVIDKSEAATQKLLVRALATLKEAHDGRR